MARHVLLIGMMGSGKTTVGRLLARKLGRPFIDTDREIEKHIDTRIPAIFAERGEAAFRAEETAMLKQMAELPRPTVIACGGGIVVSPENLPLLKQLGYTFWLQMSLEHLTWRLRHSQRRDRPLLQVADWPKALSQLVAEREHLYKQASDVTVKVDGLSPEQVAVTIARTLRMLEGRR